MNVSRPILKFKPTAYDRILGIISGIVLVGIWLLCLYYFSEIPERIPVHFNFSGNADRYGAKSMIWLLPALGTILYFSLTLIMNVPHRFNYPVQIHAGNAEMQYRNALQMIRFVRAWLVILFFLLTTRVIQQAMAHPTALQNLLLPFVLISLLVPLIYFMIKSFQYK